MSSRIEHESSLFDEETVLPSNVASVAELLPIVL